MTRRYKAFISYSWADRAWGEWLHRTLETYRAPKGVADGQSLHPIFKDREEEAAGGSVGAAIEAALGASEFLIVICSPRSAQSTWVNREVAWFKTHKDKGRVLALIVDGEPGASAKPGREAEECFPKTLTRKVGGDLQPTEEWEDAPLAADARPEGDGKRGAKLKLAAALLGVGLDALIRRDERRRTIRRRLVTSAAVGLSAAMSVLAFVAATQRDAAVAAQKEAVKARDDAEGIIELILTDLKSDLEGFGTLKSVTQIGNRAIGYYEGQDVKALTPDQLGRRARVLLMLGEADNKRGDLTAALARYETAAATTKEQLARDPESPQRIYDHAQSVFWVGYIAWQKGDRATAKHQLTEYHDLVQALVAKDAANEDWQAELDYAYSNLGTLALDTGDAVEAETWFLRSLSVTDRVLAASPEDIERIFNAAQSRAWLADSYFPQAKIELARRARLEEIDLYERAITLAPENTKIRMARLIARNGLSAIDIATGDLDKAIGRSKAIVSEMKEFSSLDPDNGERAEHLSFSLSVLGEAYLHADRLAEAREALGQALAAGESLTAQMPLASASRIKLVVQPKLHIASLAVRRRDFAAAIDLYTDIILDLKDAVDVGNREPSIVRRFCAALAGRARLSTRHQSDWSEVINLIAASPGKQRPDTLTTLAEALLRSGEADQAAEIVERLWAAGYHHPELVALATADPRLEESIVSR